MKKTTQETNAAQEKKMTNLKMFIWGIKHIAKNHRFTCSTNYREDGFVFISGDNVPTMQDVKMLCEDCKIDECNVERLYGGIAVILPTDDEGYIDKAWSKAEYEVPFHEFWRRLV